jgi:hypothetical protein
MSKKISLFALSAITTFVFSVLVFSASAVKAQDAAPLAALGTPFYAATTTQVNLPYSQLTYTNTVPYYFIPTYNFVGAGGYGIGGGCGGCGNYFGGFGCNRCYRSRLCGSGYGCGGFGALGGLGLGYGLGF